MTETPKVDYFIIDGKIVNKADEDFSKLCEKYIKPIEYPQSKDKEEKK